MYKEIIQNDPTNSMLYDCCDHLTSYIFNLDLLEFDWSITPLLKERFAWPRSP